MASHSSSTSRGKRRRFAPQLEVMEGRQLLHAAIPGVTLDPVTVPKFVNPLLNPLDPNLVYSPLKDSMGNVVTTPVKLQNGTTAQVPLYQVGASQIQEDLGLGLKDAQGNTVKTWVYGYGGLHADGTSATTYPGGSFVVDSGSPIAVQWTNGLPTGQHLLPVDPTVLDQPTHDQSGTPYYTVTTNQSTGAQTVNFTSGVPMVPHVHGGHTTAASDGTPLQWFTAGGQMGPPQQGPDFVSNPFVYDNSQQAAPLWYHDHAMGVTRLNVYAGLAGFYIIHDTNEKGLIAEHKLPAETYDVPLAIQDRMFTAPGVTGPNDPNGLGGQLYYPADVLKGTAASYPSVHPEFFGDTILVNGQAWPVLDVDPRMYRFRVLDGSDSRFYNLQFNVAAGKDQPTGINQPFLQIGTDDGLLHNPVGLTNLLIAPGERADIVFDFSKLAGQTIIMTNTAKGPFPHGAPSFPETTGQIMAFRVKNITPIQDVNLTTATVLNAGVNDPLVPLVPTSPNTPRQLGLFETTDPYGRLIQKLGQKDPTTNVFSTQDYVDTTMHPMQVQLIDNKDGTQSVIEEWQVFNTTADTHPIHLHQVMFQIVSRQQFTWTVTNNPTPGAFTVTGLKGSPTGPAANEAGWKDTVQMNPGTVTTIRAKFDLPGKYVWHCHILEHEEHDMMNEYEVVPALAKTASSQPAAQLATSSSVVPNTLALAPSVAAVSPDPANSIDPLAAEVISPSKKKQ